MGKEKIKKTRRLANKQEQVEIDRRENDEEERDRQKRKKRDGHRENNVS